MWTQGQRPRPLRKPSDAQTSQERQQLTLPGVINPRGARPGPSAPLWPSPPEGVIISGHERPSRASVLAAVFPAPPPADLLHPVGLGSGITSSRKPPQAASRPSPLLQGGPVSGPSGLPGPTLGLQPSLHLLPRTVNAPSWSRSPHVSCASTVPQRPRQVWPPLRSRHLNPSNAGFTTGGPGGHQCCPIRVGRKRHKSRTATPPCPGPLPAGGPGTGEHPGAPGHRLSSEAAFPRTDTAIGTRNPYNEGARTSCSSAWGREGLSSPMALYYGKNQNSARGSLLSMKLRRRTEETLQDKIYHRLGAVRLERSRQKLSPWEPNPRNPDNSPQRDQANTAAERQLPGRHRTRAAEGTQPRGEPHLP